eukprot:101187_1
MRAVIPPAIGQNFRNKLTAPTAYAMMEDADADEEYDLTKLEPNIYKTFNQAFGTPSQEDLENNIDNPIAGQVMTDRNEVIGWLFFDFSNGPHWQVFMALCWTTFLVQTSTQYACTESLTYGCDINNDAINADESVVITVAGITVKPESFYFLVVSFSGIIQLIAYIMIGGLMDYSSYQYHIFRFTAIIAACFDAPYIFLSDPSSYLFAGFFTAVGIVFYGLSTIAYNSQLVDIVDNHWLIQRSIRKNLSNKQRNKVREVVVDDLSNYGIACSYLGSVVMTLYAIVIFATMADTTYVIEPAGRSSGTGVDELYAKKVYGVNVSYIYSPNPDIDEQIVSIQLQYSYGDIDLAGAVFGTTDINDVNYILKHDHFHSDHAINKVYLWYNSDKTISAMQFGTTSSDVTSQIIGGVNGTMNVSERVTVDAGEYDDFVVGGYTVYDHRKHDKTIISGFDLLFVSSDGQWSSTLSLRVVSFSVFVFWMAFQSITLCTMKKRLKPPVPAHSSILTISTKSAWHTLSETFRDYKHIRYGLIGWFFYSDAIGTAMNASVLFAQLEMGFSFVELTVSLLLFEICTAVGAVAHIHLQKYLGWDAKQMTIYHLSIFAALTFYILLGLIPGIPFGLVNKWEMWAFNIVFGFNVASLVGFGRSLTSMLIPVGKENDLFSIYAITDKGSSWIGPLIMGLLSNALGLRWPLVYVLIFFLVSIPIINKIDIQEGLQQAGRLEKERRGSVVVAEMSSFN